MNLLTTDIKQNDEKDIKYNTQFLSVLIQFLNLFLRANCLMHSCNNLTK